MHAGEAAESGAAREAQQERFRLVVARVADGDDVRAGTQTGALEELVTGGATGILDRTLFPLRARGHIIAVDQERAIERGRDRRRKLLVGAGGCAKLVVEVRQAGQLQLAGGVELVQQMGERHRVGSAGHGREDPGVGTDQIMAADELPNAVEDEHQGWTGRTGGMAGTGGGERSISGAATLPFLPFLPFPPVLP
jgi:hypothetical protein